MTNMAPPLKMTIVTQAYQQTQVPHIKKYHIPLIGYVSLAKCQSSNRRTSLLHQVHGGRGGMGKEIINSLLTIQCMVK